jgi:hypothetical protein
MTKRTTNGEGPPKRTDVGYGRPPPETRFKPENKPAPRKKKAARSLSRRELFWTILQEQRRVVIDGKPKWMRTAEILVNKAFHLADAGNPTLNRLIGELLLDLDREARSDREMPVIVDPHSDLPTGVYIRRFSPDR